MHGDVFDERQAVDVEEDAHEAELDDAPHAHHEAALGQNRPAELHLRGADTEETLIASKRQPHLTGTLDHALNWTCEKIKELGGDISASIR